MTSDKGGTAFTFDLDITCEKSEIMKILKIAEKLKKYEDFEEIFRSKMTDSACEFLTEREEFAKWLDRNKWIAKKCDEYARAEEQGKLLKLPCAVGDILYEPRPERGIITEYTVTGFSYCGNTIFAHWRLNSGIYNHLDGVTVNNIGMSVFTTREEAETVLKELYTSKKYKEVRENE